MVDVILIFLRHNAQYVHGCDCDNQVIDNVYVTFPYLIDPFGSFRSDEMAWRPDMRWI